MIQKLKNLNRIPLIIIVLLFTYIFISTNYSSCESPTLNPEVSPPNSISAITANDFKSIGKDSSYEEVPSIGNFLRPTDVSVDDVNKWVYSVDRYNNRIQRFNYSAFDNGTLDGTNSLTIPTSVKNSKDNIEVTGSGQFISPSLIETDDEGSSYVFESGFSDSDNYSISELAKPCVLNRIQKFNSAGAFLGWDDKTPFDADEFVPLSESLKCNPPTSTTYISYLISLAYGNNFLYIATSIAKRLDDETNNNKIVFDRYRIRMWDKNGGKPYDDLTTFKYSGADVEFHLIRGY